MNRTRVHALAATGAAVLLLAGCGAAAEKAAEKAVEQSIESQTGGDVDIDTSGDGSINIETEDGTFRSDGQGNVEVESEDGSFSSSTSGDVPENWPEDVPLPDELTVLVGGEQDAADGRLVSIIGTTTTSPEDLLAELKGALEGWTISGEVTTTSGDGSTTGAQWETDGRRFNFSATSGPDGETSITLGHTTLS